MFESLRKTLEKRKKELPQSRELLATQVCYLFEQTAKNFFKKDLSLKALFFKDGALFVKVPQAVLRQELKLLEKEIIEKINKKIGKKILRRIVYRA